MPDAVSMYRDGTYLKVTAGEWDLSDSPFKAAEVLRMITKHDLRPASVCDIGCGAGGILNCLQKGLAPEVRFTGYDVSPQALEISKQFANDHCRFVLDDPFQDGQMFDVAMAMDVFEHVEDCFAFLRQMKAKARYKIYHIPLEVHASAAIRGAHAWPVGHIHQFSQVTALKTVEHTDQEVIDWWFTGPAQSSEHSAKTRFGHGVRRAVGALAGKTFSSRLLGGYSLLVLAK